jgi:hypothetical protein
VAEFQVVINNTSAEYGHSGGATINVVTRYGTNQFHGRAWEFVRNTDFNATGFFKPDPNAAGKLEKPALHRNQFGGTLGRTAAQGQGLLLPRLRGLSRVQLLYRHGDAAHGLRSAARVNATYIADRRYRRLESRSAFCPSTTPVPITALIPATR